MHFRANWSCMKAASSAKSSILSLLIYSWDDFVARHSFSEFPLDISPLFTRFYVVFETCGDSPSFSSLKDLLSRNLNVHLLYFLFRKYSSPLVCELLFCFANFYLPSGFLANSHSIINSRLIERFAHFRVAVGAPVARTVNNTLAVFSVQFIWNCVVSD